MLNSSDIHTFRKNSDDVSTVVSGYEQTMRVAQIGNTAGVGTVISKEQLKKGIETNVFVFSKLTQSRFGGTRINYNSILEKIISIFIVCSYSEYLNRSRLKFHLVIGFLASDNTVNPLTRLCILVLNLAELSRTFSNSLGAWGLSSLW